MASSAVDRNRKADRKKRSIGLTRVCVWVPVEHKERLKNFGKVLWGKEVDSSIFNTPQLASLAIFRYTLSCRDKYEVTNCLLFILDMLGCGLLNRHDLELYKSEYEKLGNNHSPDSTHMDDVYTDFFSSALKRVSVNENLYERFRKD